VLLIEEHLFLFKISNKNSSYLREFFYFLKFTAIKIKKVQKFDFFVYNNFLNNKIYPKLLDKLLRQRLGVERALDGPVQVFQPVEACLGPVGADVRFGQVELKKNIYLGLKLYSSN
jgi:hypothetical protein